jgi:glycosyltransferase involved in cell wall biosynthesis
MRSLLVAPGPLDHTGGGAPIRWRALQTALAGLGDVGYLALPPAARFLGGGGAGPPGGTVPTGAPFAGVYSADLAATLARQVQRDRPDVVVVSELQLHRYLAELARLPLRPALVLDLHNVESDLRRELVQISAPGSYEQRRYTDEYCRAVEGVERAAIRTADQVWVCSDADRQRLSELHGPVAARKAAVVPNAVAVPATPPPVPERLAKVAFVGKLDYLPNTLAAHEVISEIAPRMRAAAPSLQVVVAGYDCPDQLRDAAEDAENVEVVDRPADPLAVLSGAVLVVPLVAGGGTRLKVLEAFSVGSPVISTAKGVEGLAVTAGVHYLHAEQPAEFVPPIASVATDRTLRRRLTAAAWERVVERYSLPALRRRVAALLG